MSAAHRHTTPDPDHPADVSSSQLEAPHIDSRVDDASPPRASPADHIHIRAHSRRPSYTQAQEQTQTHPLTAQIEHTRLRTRVAALERELAASRRNQQAIVDQYERVLEDRECHTESPDCDTEPAVTGQNRTADGSDSVRSRIESNSDSDSSSGSTSSIADLGSHVRRFLANISR